MRGTILLSDLVGIKGEHMRTKLLKTHIKADNSAKTLSKVVAEGKSNRICHGS